MTAVKDFKHLPNVPFLQTEKDMDFMFIGFALVLFFELTYTYGRSSLETQKQHNTTM